MSQPGFNELVFNQCALCASASELQASHIIPGTAYAHGSGSINML